MNTPTPTDPATLPARVAAYIAELEASSLDVPNSTHTILAALWLDFGREAVDVELEKQFNP